MQRLYRYTVFVYVCCEYNSLHLNNHGFGCVSFCVELNDPSEQRRRLLLQSKDSEAGDDEAQLPDEDFCGELSYEWG